MDERKLTAQEVRTWLLAVESDLRRLGEKLQPLLNEQRRLEERQALLQGLLRSFDQTAPNGSAPSRVPKGPGGSIARYVIEHAAEILRDEGRPLHINDLHAKFLENGFTVPGAGKPVNLIVHLRSAEEIASPMRGIYGLIDQVDAAPQKPRRTSRRKNTRTPRARGKKD